MAKMSEEKLIKMIINFNLYQNKLQDNFSLLGKINKIINIIKIY